MSQEDLLAPIEVSRLGQMSREEIEKFVAAQERVINDLVRENTTIKNKYESSKQKELYLDEEYVTGKAQVTAVSETDVESQKSEESTGSKGKKKPKKKKVQLPSQRYPDVEVEEQELKFDEPQACEHCNAEMSSTGMFEVSETLRVTPAVFKIERTKREKLRCSCCHTGLKTYPSPARITPGGSYSDEMIIDVVINKYLNLIPIERYAVMAGRNGLIDLPPQSLIQLTHYFADFVKPVYDLLKKELMSCKVLHADETRHRMLERGGYTKNGTRKSWYLWGFSNTEGTTYFEPHDTRAGSVASELLKESVCEFLVSDVYSGYGKSVKDINKDREESDLPVLLNVYCNAHALRKFKDLKDDEFDDILVLYQKIYKLDKIASRRNDDKRRLRVRGLMSSMFEEIKKLCLGRLMDHSSKSDPAAAMNYFLRNYDGLTLFIKNIEIPIDNNLQERAFRSPVVGRKTWLGNHSLKGARTSSILFSVIESCKNIGVNPIHYLKKLVEDLHQGKSHYTPKTYAKKYL